MATAQYSIEKLNAQNYVNWAADVKHLLLEKNAWDIVDDREKLPVIKDGSGVTQKDVADFHARSRSARAIIYLNIEPEYRKIIENEENVVETWKKLKLHFQPDNRSRHMSLFSELCACKIKPGENIDLYASRLRRISEQLSAINQPIKEVYISFQFLRYLPSQFDSIVQSILRWPEEKFIFKDIVIELIAEETRLKLKDCDLIEPTASNIQRKSSVKCYRCGKPGHRRADCRSSQEGPRKIQQVDSRRRAPHPMSGRRTARQWYKDNSRGSPAQSSRSSSSSSSCSGSDHHRSTWKQRSTKDSVNQRDKSNVCSFVYAFINESCNESENFIFDTAASHHFCKSKNMFIEFSPIRGERMAIAIDGVTFPIEGKGMLKLKFGQRIFYFKDVLYSPKLRRNLISGPKLDVNGVTFKGEQGIVRMYQDGEHIFSAFLKDGVYQMYPKVLEEKVKHVRFEACTVDLQSMELWHRRYAHINTHIIKRTCRNKSARGLPDLKRNGYSCETCKINKFRRVSFKTIGRTRSKKPLELLHMDMWGPAEVTGRNGERYFLSIIDDYSKKTSLYPLTEKSKVFEVFKRHVTQAERSLDCRVKSIRTDNGREFDNASFDAFCKEHGIRHEFTNTYTPEQNGIAERYNQTVLNGARTILDESGLGRKFWPEAALYFTYTWNRVCHKHQQKTACELYRGTRPSVNHLRPFGVKTYVGIPRQCRTKLDAKAKVGYLVGYAFKTKGYRIWIPETDRIIETINVLFDEGSGAVMGPKPSEDNQKEDQKESPSFQSTYEPLTSDGDDESQDDSPSNADERIAGESRETSSEEEGSDDEGRTPLREATWIRRPSKRPDGSRTDIYYYEKDKPTRLRSLNDIKTYCKEKRIHFTPEIFSFKGKDDYEGEVSAQGTSGVSSSHST